MLNAVRDNPERVEFVGYNTQLGALHRLHRSRASSPVWRVAWAPSMPRSSTAATVLHAAALWGAYLLFTFLGGATFFFGPIIGAVLMVICGVLLSELTKAWLLYLGLIFLFMVMYAPGGFASLIMMNLRVAAFGKLKKLVDVVPGFGRRGASLALIGAAAMIEMIYHRQLNEATGTRAALHGRLTLNSAPAWTPGFRRRLPHRRRARACSSWCGATMCKEWGEIQEEIEKEIKRREAL